MTPLNYVELTVQTGQVTGTLTGVFPALISHTFSKWKSVAHGGHIQHTDGVKPADFGIYADSGFTTLLPFEIESWNATTGAIVAWVGVTSIADSVVVYVAYNDSAQTTALDNPTGVWPSQFKSVYHFGDGSTLSLADSTSNARTLTNHGGTVAAGGKTGAGSASFNSTSSYLDSASVPFSAAPGAIAMWVYRLAGGVPASILDGGSSDWHGFYGQVGATGATAANAITTSNFSPYGQADGSFTSDAWQRVWFVFGGAASRTVYVNGVAGTPETTSVTPANTPTKFTLGASGRSVVDNFYGGLIDECYALDAVPSAAWIEADYNNQSAPTTFWTLGAEQGPGSPPPTPNTYYVDNAGSDSGTGLVGDPWQTIAKVNAFMGSFQYVDIVKFTSGQSFTGSIAVTAPLAQITTTGAGKATIESSTDYGIVITDVSDIEVSNLIFHGTDPVPTGTFPTKSVTCANTVYGIHILKTDTGAGQENVTIDRCEASGYYVPLVCATVAGAGLTPTVAQDGFTLTNNYFSDSIFAGMWHYVRGDNYAANAWGVNATNFLIEGNEVETIWGIDNTNSGYGCSWESLGSSCVVRRNFIHDNGEASNQGGGGTGIGIFLLGCNGAYVYENEVARQRTPSGVDGAGIDCEGSANCRILRNYIHDGDGMALEAGVDGTPYPAWANNVFAFNVCVNNGVVGGVSGFRTFTTGLTGLYIAFNTFYQAGSAGSTFSGDSFIVVNNICIAAIADFGTITNVVELVGNTYYVLGSGTFSLTVGGSARGSLAALRAAGYEAHAAVNYGYEGNPSLSNLGAHADLWPALPTTLTDYDISALSSAIGTGIDPSLLSVPSPYSTDFHNSTFAASVLAHGWTPGADQIADILAGFLLVKN